MTAPLEKPSRPGPNGDPWVVASEELVRVLQPYLDQHRSAHPTFENENGVRTARKVFGAKWESNVDTTRTFGALAWLAQESEINERRLWSIFTGETKHVSLRIVDKILSGLGRPDLFRELAITPNPRWTDKAWAKWRKEEEDASVRRLGDEHYAHLSGDLYAILDADVIALLTAAKDEFGSWRALAFRTGYRERVFRRWRNGGGTAARRRITIPMKVLDDILTAAGLNQRLDEVHWFTVEELVSLGIWKPMIPPHLALEDEPQRIAAS